jgi:hypothetical protein
MLKSLQETIGAQSPRLNAYYYVLKAVMGGADAGAGGCFKSRLSSPQPLSKGEGLVKTLCVF